MKLHNPFVITSRLLPGLQIRDNSGLSEISIEIEGETSSGRTRYRYFIDAPGIQHEDNDLKSGCQGGDIQEGMASLLSFLCAAAESFRYRGMEGENADLFPRPVVEWASQHSDEIAMLQWEIEESKEPLIEA